MENWGVLTKSKFRILKVLLFGGNIDVVKIENFIYLKFHNFSQICALAQCKEAIFKLAIKNTLIIWDTVICLI